jgi:alpha-D-ribose 1-methylphosphonate 5-phosphate C-P lyase
LDLTSVIDPTNDKTARALEVLQRTTASLVTLLRMHTAHVKIDVAQTRQRVLAGAAQPLLIVIFQMPVANGSRMEQSNFFIYIR